MFVIGVVHGQPGSQEIGGTILDCKHMIILGCKSQGAQLWIVCAWSAWLAKDPGYNYGQLRVWSAWIVRHRGGDGHKYVQIGTFEIGYG